MYNPTELEIHLFCNGLRIDGSCTLEQDARSFSRTRAGLGSGLELQIPGPLKTVSMNAPVEEPFAQNSPFVLIKVRGDYFVRDNRTHDHYRVEIPAQPAWYARETSNGIPMDHIGVLQGTYLGVYIDETCGFWHHQPSKQCRFCTTGLNLGNDDYPAKTVQDVVETAKAAKEESGITFVHFNTGYHGNRGLDLMAPYVKAIKEEVGCMVGVQAIPAKDLWKYDWLVDLGANHFSFCYEFHNREYFQRLLPGKEALVGQKRFFRALEYAAGKLPRGAVSGEIIVGVEPIEDTIKAIEYITDSGAFPTVCIFRPTLGSMMEDHPVPPAEEMTPVMRHMYDACRRKMIPVGLAPNIEVSLIVNPDDGRYLVPQDWRESMYRMYLQTLRTLARPKFAYELRPRTISADANSDAAYRKDEPRATAEPVG